MSTLDDPGTLRWLRALVAARIRRNTRNLERLVARGDQTAEDLAAVRIQHTRSLAWQRTVLAELDVAIAKTETPSR